MAAGAAAPPHGAAALRSVRAPTGRSHRPVDAGAPVAQPVSARPRRRVVVGLLAVLSLGAAAGCSGAGEVPAVADTPSSEAPTPTPTPTPPPSPVYWPLTGLESGTVAPRPA